VLSFAASSALARQAAAGAPADLFISADEAWMDDLDKRHLLRPGTRVDLLTNRLVLIAPVGSSVRLTIRPGFLWRRRWVRGVWPRRRKRFRRVITRVRL
jgi:molybdate transport system substrate-binding protein